MRFASDNNKAGVFAYAKDFSATLEMTEGRLELWCGALRLDPSALLSPARGKGVGKASRRMTW
jgi:hypothetical protein